MELASYLLAGRPIAGVASYFTKATLPPLRVGENIVAALKALGFRFAHKAATWKRFRFENGVRCGWIRPLPPSLPPHCGGPPGFFSTMLLHGSLQGAEGF